MLTGQFAIYCNGQIAGRASVIAIVVDLAGRIVCFNKYAEQVSVAQAVVSYSRLLLCTYATNCATAPL